MHITRLTDYSFLLLCEMKFGEVISSKSLSEKTRVPFATANKLLRLLNKGGFISSKGGKSGGFVLTIPHSKISLLDVIFCIEGTDSHLTECISNKNITCQLKNSCKIASRISLIDKEIHSILKTKYLSDLIS